MLIKSINSICYVITLKINLLLTYKRMPLPFLGVVVNYTPEE